MILLKYILLLKLLKLLKKKDGISSNRLFFIILGDIRGLTISAQSLVISKFSVKIVPNLPVAGEKQFVCHVGLNAVSPSYYSSSTLSQKGESRNGITRKQNTTVSRKNTNISYSLIRTHSSFSNNIYFNIIIYM